MRARNALTICATLLVLTGCGGGGSSKSRGSATAPVNSGTPGGVTSGTNPGGGGTTPVIASDALISSFNLDELIHVDAVTGQPGNRWSVGNGPVDVANWGNDAYVANALSQDVTVIDRLANNVAGTIDVTSQPITGVSFLSFLDSILKPMVRPTGIAVTPLGTKAFSANLLNVTVINTTTNQPTKSIIGMAPINLGNILANPSGALNSFMASPVPGLGMAKVACNNDVAVVTCLITGKLMRIDARQDQVIDYIDVGRAPIGVTIARNKAYVACAMSQETVVVDLVTGQIRARLRGGMLPIDAATNMAEDRVYVANAFSGDISVIDTAADVIIDTLPAGLSVTSLLAQMGITLPATGGNSVMNLLNSFLQGYTTGLSNPASFGNLLLGSSSSLLSPGALVNGLLTGFLAFAGVSQQALNGINLPAFGIWSVAVAHDPNLICSANAIMGDMAITQAQSRSVNSLMGLTGLGPADVSTVWRR